MYKSIRPLLFSIDPERAHQLALNGIENSRYIFGAHWLLRQIFKAPSKPVEAFGLTFPNPVGLAAGYDKDASAVRGLSTLGFGHIEIGTVTPLAQSGNPYPRVFRLPEDQAVINRMGFPSLGSAKVVKNLEKLGRCRYAPTLPKRVINLRGFIAPGKYRRSKSKMILGVNIGKNKNIPNEEAVLDYLSLLELFAPCADYLTINISSPNTVGLRDLQGREALEVLLTQLHEQRKIEQEKLNKSLPLLVKLAPDLSDAELYDALDVIMDTGMDGVVATNTTIARDPKLVSAKKAETGGLSGAPLTSASDSMLKKIVKRVDGKLPIISVGGIMSPEDAKRRLDMGATLVQLYTGLIYKGPRLVKRIVKSL